MFTTIPQRVVLGLLGLVLLPLAAMAGKAPVAVGVVRDAEPMAAPAGKVEEVEPAASAQVKVSESGTFTIDVSEADVVKVIRMLALQSQRNIIASKEVRGTVSANLHNVTIKEALDAILKANGFAYREKGSFIYVYTARELAELEKAERQMATEMFRVNYTPAASAVGMLKPMLSADAQVSFTAAAKSGIEASATATGGQDHAAGEMIVVRDYPENLEKVRKLLKEIDRRPQQILVEAVILRAALSDDNALGIDFTVLGGVDFAGISNVGGTSGQALSGAIVENKNAGNIVDSGYVGAGTGFTSGTKGTPAGGLRIGLVKNNVAVFLQALEEVSNTTVLANPKILALNRQKGEVIVGKKTGYLTKTVTDTAAVETVEFLETGTRLIFRPFIGDDGFIRMEVHPEDSDGGLVNNLPVKTTTEVTSNVMVRDGHTIVIGGLFREVSDSGRGQVPGLGNAPILGPLFRRQRDRTEREEIIILLTPHIVKDERAYADASESLLRDAEQLRVGVRRGMMPFGRERLAENAYEKAVAEMSRPNPNRTKALWHLDCATNLHPTFLEAIAMKQKLSGAQLSTVDNSSVRYFVRRQILAESAPVTPPAGPATRSTVETPATVAPLAAAPATQPVASPQALTPATQPVAATEPQIEVTMAPATQPAEALAEAVPATCPASQPCRAEAEPVCDQAELAAQRQPPATQPAEDTTVTELPAGEATGQK